MPRTHLNAESSTSQLEVDGSESPRTPLRSEDMLGTSFRFVHAAFQPKKTRGQVTTEFWKERERGSVPFRALLLAVLAFSVPGAAADDYWFTSALPTQILRELAPGMGPKVSGSPAGPESDCTGGPGQPLADDRPTRLEVEGATGAESAGQR
jgi:hypothetical protein